MTLQDFFEQPDIEGNKLFYNVCQYNSKKVTFLCNKSLEKHFSTELQKVLNNFIPGNITTEFQNLIMNKEKPPVLIGSKAVSQQIAVFMKVSASTIINLISDHSISENSSPLKTAGATYLQAATKVAGVVSAASTITPTHASTTTTNTALIVIDNHQYSKLNARIDKILSAIEQKNNFLTDRQQKLDTQMASLIEKLSKFAKQFSTLHEKINNTHNKIDTMQE